MLENSNVAEKALEVFENIKKLVEISIRIRINNNQLGS